MGGGGGGVRGQVKGVVVDLRGNWELPFSDNPFPGGTGQNTLGLSTGNDGRWNATLNIGWGPSERPSPGRSSTGRPGVLLTRCRSAL